MSTFGQWFSSMRQSQSSEHPVTFRQAAVAGLFYPAEASELEQMVNGMLQEAELDAPAALRTPKALISPHAGYIYSGCYAAKAYQRLPAHANINRVVVLAPNHRLPVQGIAAPCVDQFATPLGLIDIDQEQIERLCEKGWLSKSDEPHTNEHSIEVQLPFLQKKLEHFRLVPLLVGEDSIEQACQLVDYFWRQTNTLIVISSDLSHFLNYQNAQKNDAATHDLIMQCQPILNGDQACGCNALNGLLAHLQNANQPIEHLALGNSGDTAGDKQRVVGYGAYVVYDA